MATGPVIVSLTDPVEELGVVSYVLVGGVPPYTVQLINSNLPNNVHNGDGTFSFINVPDGTYDLIATDDTGCVQTQTGLVVIKVFTGGTATIPTTQSAPATIVLVAVGGTDSPSPSSQIVLSIDGGDSWTNVVNNSSSFILTAVEFFDTSTGIAIGDGAGVESSVYRTTDSGNTWLKISPIEPTARQSLKAISSPSSNIMYVGGDSGFIYKTIDKGLSWLQAPTAGTVSQNLKGMHFFNNDFGVSVSSSFADKILRTFNGGASWTNPQSALNESFQALAFGNSAVGLAAADTNTIYKTSDAGASWVDKSSVLPSSFSNLRIRSIDFIDGFIGYAVGLSDGPSAAILRTQDAGESWIDLSSTIPAGIDHLRSSVWRNINEGWVTTANGKVLKTTDGALTWTTVDGDVTGAFLEDIFIVVDSQTSGDISIGFSGFPIDSFDEFPECEVTAIGLMPFVLSRTLTAGEELNLTLNLTTNTTAGNGSGVLISLLENGNNIQPIFEGDNNITLFGGGNTYELDTTALLLGSDPSSLSWTLNITQAEINTGSLVSVESIFPLVQTLNVSAGCILPTFGISFDRTTFNAEGTPFDSTTTPSFNSGTRIGFNVVGNGNTINFTNPQFITMDVIVLGPESSGTGVRYLQGPSPIHNGLNTNIILSDINPLQNRIFTPTDTMTFFENPFGDFSFENVETTTPITMVVRLYLWDGINVGSKQYMDEFRVAITNP